MDREGVAVVTKLLMYKFPFIMLFMVFHSNECDFR